MITKKGIPASPGVAIGPALVLDTEEYRIPHRVVRASEVHAQIRALDDALASSRNEIREFSTAVSAKFGQKAASIFAFHEHFLADRQLRGNVVELIEKHHYTAAYAFCQEMNRQQRMFLAVTDPYIRERVEDLFDIERRVLRHILGRAREDISRLTEPVVIVAHDMTPSQAAGLNREQILGIAIDVGGQTSHTVILARMLGIPAVVGLHDIASDISGGELVVVDGTHGIAVANPDDEALARYRAQATEYHKFEESLVELRDLPAVTRDGTAVTLMANIELAAEARSAMETGSQGIGLYRTEFIFLSAATQPTEDEQFEILQTAVRHAGGKPITIRTADFGADKHIPWLALPKEDNPFLGLRSIRYCLANLDFFKAHLRAILRASAFGDVRIMFPMITTLMELRQAKSVLADVMEDLDDHAIPYRADAPIGIMVETPAAAMTSGAFAREVQFMSIGTNDLTQYTLAVDRGNVDVAYLYAPHSPPVLALIQMVVTHARRANIGVHLCGEMAGNPLYCQLLLGMGLRHLSMPPKNIPEIKKIVRSTTIRKCQSIAKRVMEFDADRQVLNYLRDETRKIIPEAV